MMKKQRKNYVYEENKKEYSSIQDQKKIIGKRLNFAASESYKVLRTNLMFSMADENKCKVIGVTSALPGEGKSTTSINIAFTLAETNKNILLIEADMRIPVASKLLRLDQPMGLSHVLSGICELNDAISKSVILDTLCVLPAGEIPPNPSELLSSERMKRVLATLSESFDYIIVDLPPITAVSDGLAISNLLSGMIVVVRQDYCDQRSLAATMRQMEFLQVKVLGFVMNCAQRKRQAYKKYSYSHKYKYSYRHTDQNEEKETTPKEAESDTADV